MVEKPEFLTEDFINETIYRLLVIGYGVKEFDKDLHGGKSSYATDRRSLSLIGFAMDLRSTMEGNYIKYQGINDHEQWEVVNKALQTSYGKKYIPLSEAKTWIELRIDQTISPAEEKK